MDSQSFASENSAAPLPCPRTMPVQPLAIWTPAALVGAFLTALLVLPRALVLAPAVIRRRA